MKNKILERRSISNIIITAYFDRIYESGTGSFFRITHIRNRNPKQVPNCLFIRILLRHIESNN